jgi:hypothetical protein
MSIWLLKIMFLFDFYMTHVWENEPLYAWVIIQILMYKAGTVSQGRTNYDPSKNGVCCSVCCPYIINNMAFD